RMHSSAISPAAGSPWACCSRYPCSRLAFGRSSGRAPRKPPLTSERSRTMPTPLARKIKTLIRASGPINVADYFSLCLADPEYGYYRTRNPFGSAGDFVTAPEVSQLFGEMLGVFVVHAWQKHGGPANVRIVEIGPG